MIHASTEPQKKFTVCDPFMGSASSAIATIKNNCNYIGCDISKESFQIAKMRINSFLDNRVDILHPKSSKTEEKKFWE